MKQFILTLCVYISSYIVKNFDTPLLKAVGNNNLKMVKLLMEELLKPDAVRETRIEV